MNTYINREKIIIKFGVTEIEKHKFHQYKKRISIKKNMDINKIVSNNITFGKKHFKYFIGYEDAKKLNLYVYFSQKWVPMKQTLMKVNKHLFW